MSSDLTMCVLKNLRTKERFSATALQWDFGDRWLKFRTGAQLVDGELYKFTGIIYESIVTMTFTLHPQHRYQDDLSLYLVKCDTYPQLQGQVMVS